MLKFSDYIVQFIFKRQWLALQKRWFFQTEKAKLELWGFHTSFTPSLLTHAQLTLTSYLPAVCINYAPVYIREDLLDRGRLRVPGILLINDDHGNPLFY